jgi:hypothetical protein
LSQVARNHSAYVSPGVVLVGQAAAPMAGKTLSAHDLDLVEEVARSWFVIVRGEERSQRYPRRRHHVGSSRHVHNCLACTLGLAGPRSPPWPGYGDLRGCASYHKSLVTFFRAFEKTAAERCWGDVSRSQVREGTKVGRGVRRRLSSRGGNRDQGVLGKCGEFV